MKNGFQFLLSGCASLALLACGDDVTKMTTVTNETTGMEVAASADSLGTCDSAAIGKMAFASSENAVYVCAATGWEALSKSATDGKDGSDGKDGENGLDGASCTVKALASGLGYKVLCGGDSVGVILNGTNGKDGADGKDGENGLDGASCTVKALASGSGYKVLCGGDSVGVILNGTNGKDGADYEEGCSLAEDRDGTVKFVCGKTDTVTLYKAICGSEAYDPAEKFCFADSAYDLCASKSYDPAMEFCANDSLFALCGGKSYDPLKMFCFADSAYDLCASKSYDPTEEFCQENTVHDLCGGKTYDPTDSVWKCYEGKLKMQFTDIRDGKNYLAVKIGEQVWMAENLNYDTTGYCYNNDTSNCETYGRLYQWAVAQKVCPSGWHLPSLAEWKTLDSAVANILYERKTDSVGYALKSTTGWKDNGSKSGNGSDLLGFNAVGAGYLRIGTTFQGFSMSADFWSSTNSYNWSVDYDTPKVDLSNRNAPSYGFSIRCIKD